jgi:hypothetical protein
MNYEFLILNLESIKDSRLRIQNTNDQSAAP